MRLPTEPLRRWADLLGCSHGHISRVTGRDRARVQKLMTSETMSVWVADEFACAIGFHPINIWPDFHSYTPDRWELSGVGRPKGRVA